MICFRNAISQSDSSFYFLIIVSFWGVSSKWICMYVFVGFLSVCVWGLVLLFFSYFYYWSIIDLETVVAPGAPQWFSISTHHKMITTHCLFFFSLSFEKQTLKIFMKSNLPVYSTFFSFIYCFLIPLNKSLPNLRSLRFFVVFFSKLYRLRSYI